MPFSFASNSSHRLTFRSSSTNEPKLTPSPPSRVINFYTLDDLGPLPRIQQRPLSTRHRIAQASQPQRHAYRSLDSTTSHPAIMSSRPGSSHRPNHISLPPNDMTSPAGSPRPPASPTSPRSSFLPSFMRTRSRTITQTNRPTTASGDSPQSREPSNGPPSGLTGANTVTRSVSTPVSGGMSAAASQPTPAPQPLPTEPAESKTHRIRLVPHLETSRSLAFDPVVREVLPIIVPPGVTPSAAAASITSVGPALNGKPPALLLKIGRFTDKSQLPVPHTAASNGGVSGSNATIGPNGHASGSGAGTGSAPVTASLTIAGGGGDICSPKVAFKSKVVSRSHAEIWCEPGGKFFIRDTSSSSGTFLNHIRLSSPNTESRPTALNDGDVLQLGVDYQGGMEDMFRCVKMRVELGREWQRAANEFNTNALKQLKALGGDVKGKSVDSPVSASKGRKASVTDCCICLFSVTVCQSLFIAPCSHVFHYKCIRPLLQQHYPGFSCPLCRTFANLEEDVEMEDAWEIASRRASVISRRPSNHSIRLPHPADDAPHQTASSPMEGQPSTGIVIDGQDTNVEQLLSGGPNDEEDDNADVEVSPRAMFHRQATAVEPHVLSSQVSDDVDMAPQTPGPLSPMAIDLTHDSTAHPNGADGQTLSVAIPQASSSVDNTSSFDSQTPRNETFLSTLAPGVHQRLDLARQMDMLGRDESLPEITEREGEEAMNEEDEEEEVVDSGTASRPKLSSGIVRGENPDSGSGSRTESEGMEGERGDDGWVQFDTDEHGIGSGSRRRDDVTLIPA
ncbi:hypothetical protein BD324DRAFT_347823 [Kockovaella imperatae]|uniref:SMAD/FHA domain-containing protein n=1 Tax=Kockovaella imperatae TaxID=4999 RepID=A0A1Y1UMD4_9TREE|nr:hypothetical protein BD324DRAFT_347823 [Kockovaella imperatae]ORX38295.1 hypothetical protein BD324DRAFT_347823 [Kockovaella imperatae]